MIILLAISSLLMLAYGLLVLNFWRQWQRIPIFQPPPDINGISISIIIPARNEEENIAALLTAIQQQTYPAQLFEVIVVDDHSTDNTASIIRQFHNVKLIQLTDDGINSYKKKALETGIKQAKGELIVTTDADCVPGPHWLTSIAAMKVSTNAVFIAAPVYFNSNRTVLQMFQAIDFMMLQGITGAVVHSQTMNMCNGANLTYERRVFQEVNGFDGIDHIASGDDMLLMHKISTRYPGRTKYLKFQPAIVATAPMQTWRSFINQRIRWSSKATLYSDKKIFPVLLLVYLLNACFPALLIAGFYDHDYWIYFAGLWIIKTWSEIPLFLSVARFFQQEKLFQYFFILQPVHITYTLVAGFLGQFGKYQWKGRKVK